MGILIFLVGFMMCGFIVYSILMYTIWKIARGESIGEWTISRKKTFEPYYYRSYTSYTRPNYTPRYDNVINPTPNPVYLSSEADGICDIFEEFLTKYDIKIPCEDAGEEKEREEGGNAAIYGMAYGDLQEEVEQYLRSMAESMDRRGWK